MTTFHGDPEIKFFDCMRVSVDGMSHQYACQIDRVFEKYRIPDRKIHKIAIGSARLETDLITVVVSDWLKVQT